ncbi:MAG: Kazal-type serine protease inhibitor [Candidatus Paceibacterota bacterium]
MEKSIKKYFILVSFLWVFSFGFCFASDFSGVSGLSPQNGETIIAGDIYNITWEYSGNPGGNLLIDLVSNNGAGQKCYLGAAPVELKHYALDINNTLNCKNLLADKGTYFLSARLSSSMNTIIKSGVFTTRYDISDICGPIGGQSSSRIPEAGLCDYGKLTSLVSVYDENNFNDGNWHWSCANIKCRATDPNREIKLKLKATEIISLIGDANSPEILEYWAEGACGTLNIPTGYNLSSCETKSENDKNNYAGAPNAAMIKVKIKKIVFCSQNYSPVCGKDNKTYINECYAKKEGAEIAYNGSCSAKITGTCGASNNKIFSQKPSINLCQSGIAGEVSKYSPWTWVCKGVNGGESAECSAKEAIAKPVPLNELSRAELLEILMQLLIKLQLK